MSLFDALQNLEKETSTRGRDKECARAPFGWQGGKSRSLDKILPHLPYRTSYTEVFGGSGAVLLTRRESSLEVYNDKYSGLTCFYRCIRDPKTIDELLARLELVIHSREEFVWCRDTWDKVEDPVERAARWYYMIQTSFATKGVAWARASYSRGQIGQKLQNNLKLFWPIHQRLKNVQVENQDWRKLVEDYDHADAVFYMDPPYLDTTNSSYAFEMPEKDHAELLDVVFKMKGYVAVSGYGHPLYMKQDWSHVYSWTANVTTIAKAYREENHQEHREHDVGSRQATEYLFIKDSK